MASLMASRTCRSTAGGLLSLVLSTSLPVGLEAEVVLAAISLLLAPLFFLDQILSAGESAGKSLCFGGMF